MAAWTVALAAACLLGLTGCSPGESDPGGTGGTKSGFESLSGAEMCRILPLKMVERQFDDVEFFRAEGQVGGRGQFRDVNCHYGGAGLSLDTWIRRTVGPDDVGAHLDLIFTEFDEDHNEEVIDYERIDGLGAAAGYGKTAPTGLVGNTLAVILNVGQDQYAVKLSTRPDATLEQLKPLAEVLIRGLQSVLR